MLGRGQRERVKSESRSRPAHPEGIPHFLWRAAGTGLRWLTQQEAVVLVALLVVVLSLFAFVRIAEELGEGELASFDERLLRLLRVPGQPHVPVGPPWLLEVAQ